jgi:hypothetical protein
VLHVNIKRFTQGGNMYESARGNWVEYQHHQRAIEDKDAEIARLNLKLSVLAEQYATYREMASGALSAAYSGKDIEP